MFSLRSSPSPLVVPCSLRGAVNTESGMTFAPRRLTAPRPKRVVMPLIYYHNEVGAQGNGNSSTGNGGSNGGVHDASAALGSSPSTYAGVFESGGDPAQVRASLNHGSRRSSATPVHHSKLASQNNHEERVDHDTAQGGTHQVGAGEARADDGDTDCLFEMDGIKDSAVDPEASSYSAVGCGVTGRDADHLTINVNASDEAARGCASVSSVNSIAGGHRPVIGRDIPGTSDLAVVYGEKQVAVKNKGPTASQHLRQPRVIGPGPGRRCIGSGMYRLRLSTSC